MQSYTKFLKGMCIIKRRHNVQKNSFLTEQVGALFRFEKPFKYKDPGRPISYVIDQVNIEKLFLI